MEMSIIHRCSVCREIIQPNQKHIHHSGRECEGFFCSLGSSRAECNVCDSGAGNTGEKCTRYIQYDYEADIDYFCGICNQKLQKDETHNH